MNAESGELHRSTQNIPGRPAFLGADRTSTAHRRRFKSIIEREFRTGRQASAARALSRPDSVKAYPSPARTLAGIAAVRANDWEEF